MTTSNTKFAIDLSDEGISLLHQSVDGSWEVLGSVALNAENFSSGIESLKTDHFPTGKNNSPVQVRIPREQVYVSKIDIGKLAGAAVTSRVNKFLSENTPYKATDLVMDVEKGTDESFVSAVTKQTISEAKDFVLGYGFEPLYYTTVIDKAEFPRSPRFYDGKKPKPKVSTPKPKAQAKKPKQIKIEVPSPPAMTPKIKDPTTKAASEESNATSKAAITPEITSNASAQNTTGSKPSNTSEKCPEDVEKTTKDALKAAPSKFTDLPKKATTTVNTKGAKKALAAVPKITAKAKPKLAAPASKAIKMPQSDAHFSKIGDYLKPQQLLLVFSLVFVAALYWFFTMLFDGKKEIARLQEAPFSDVAVVIERPDTFTRPAIEDTSPTYHNDAEAEANHIPNLKVSEPLISPVPIVVANATTKNPEDAPTQVESNTPETPDGMQIASINPNTPTVSDVAPKLEQTPTETLPINDKLLAPTMEGTPGPEGITLFSGQPEILPPRREQLKITPDPLKDILPLMRNPEFEEIHTAKATIEPAPQTNGEIADRPGINNTDEPISDFKGDLLALADPNLKAITPKMRPSNFKITKINLGKIDPTEINVAVEEAVINSTRPRTRPGDLSQTVIRTKAEIRSAALAPRITPDAPSVNIPSAANIQKEATESGRINKRRMSLIGVYGTASSRRALVRLPSGRYVKVKSGESISGWKISAIGESSVRIVKGSRNQILRMPK